MVNSPCLIDCDLLLDNVFDVAMNIIDGGGSGGGGGTGNYNDLTNKPKINGVELVGNKTDTELGIEVPTSVSQLFNDSGYITEGDVSQLRQDVATNTDNITAINGKIPSQASFTNQLADKEFVNSSLNSVTAFFRGSFSTYAALMSVAWQDTNPDEPFFVSNNDYAYVEDDETHSDEAWRYLYVKGTGWQAQFRVNESPLTVAQVAAINSGITTERVAKIAENTQRIDNMETISVDAGTATTLPYGSAPTVTNSGTTRNAVFNFGIPQGKQGDKGDKGDPYTLTDADKQTIVNAVIEALPKYNGEVV